MHAREFAMPGMLPDHSDIGVGSGALGVPGLAPSSERNFGATSLMRVSSRSTTAAPGSVRPCNRTQR